jgi:hypothetical protein
MASQTRSGEEPSTCRGEGASTGEEENLLVLNKSLEEEQETSVRDMKERTTGGREEAEEEGELLSVEEVQEVQMLKLSRRKRWVRTQLLKRPRR